MPAYSDVASNADRRPSRGRRSYLAADLTSIRDESVCIRLPHREAPVRE